MTGRAILNVLQVGDQLGHLEYVVGEATQAGYRALVGSGGCFPNLLADDCRALLLQRCGPLPLTTARRVLEFMRPPIPGRRIQVGGWLRDMSDADAVPRLRVAAFAVDEIGTEIMRSEAVFRVRERAAGDRIEGGSLMRLSALESGIPAQEPVNLGGVRFGDAMVLGSLVLPAGEEQAAVRRLGSELVGVDLNDDGHDLPAIVGGWLEARIGRWFGNDFRWGGRMSLGRRRPVNAGQTVAGTAVVTERNADAAGAITWRLAISLSNADYRRAIAGEATITTPSPRTL